MRKAAPLLAFLLVLAAPPLAAAQTEAGTVTLEASADTVAIGESVTLSGSISPAAGGEVVRIVDDEDAQVGTATTDADGGFSIAIEPRATRTYRATWSDAASDEVLVRVRAFVSVRMTAVRLFDRVTVRGTVDPARPGATVLVELRKRGRTELASRVTMGAAGGFVATFRVMEPGTYRARASFGASDLVRDAAVTEADGTPLPALRWGSRGMFVELLERRLVELDYRLVATRDGVYDGRTADAVIAFHKVQGMSRVSSVGPATWRALADPRTPRPRYEWKAFHFEVDQTRQVLYAVEDRRIVAILHVSTGKPSTPTRDGVFRVARKIAGFSPNRLYFPSYFDGNRALHGWTEVPTYAASHGCVRIPYWNALWVYGLADFGVRVAVYH
ncbi:MAG TPA: L,D-transpeptidase family protein [Actinomycetota bacterium]|jgi:hypothetical protein